MFTNNIRVNGVGQKVKFHSTPIKLNDIAKLKKADLLIELKCTAPRRKFL